MCGVFFSRSRSFRVCGCPSCFLCCNKKTEFLDSVSPLSLFPPLLDQLTQQKGGAHACRRPSVFLFPFFERAREEKKRRSPAQLWPRAVFSFFFLPEGSAYETQHQQQQLLPVLLHSFRSNPPLPPPPPPDAGGDKSAGSGAAARARALVSPLFSFLLPAARGFSPPSPSAPKMKTIVPAVTKTPP